MKQKGQVNLAGRSIPGMRKFGNRTCHREESKRVAGRVLELGAGYLRERVPSFLRSEAKSGSCAE